MADKRFQNSFTAPHCCFDSYPLMQYTGLKDKNGTEIYEGDVVSLGNIGKCTVVWNSGWFGFDCGDPHIPPYAPFEVDTELEGSEVIGNIHENPELLEANI